MLAACQRPAAARSGVELADIFRAYGEAYRRDHPLPVSHLKVIEAVQRCHTAALGGHLERCDSCGFERPPITPAVTAIAPSANRWPS
jgi:Transposase zinc-binding domain